MVVLVLKLEVRIGFRVKFRMEVGTRFRVLWLGLGFNVSGFGLSLGLVVGVRDRFSV